jgi:hypothetical protein
MQSELSKFFTVKQLKNAVWKQGKVPLLLKDLLSMSHSLSHRPIPHELQIKKELTYMKVFLLLSLLTLSSIRIIKPKWRTFSLNLLRIKGLYMFRALLAHPQEVLHKLHLVYCVRAISVGCGTVAVKSQLTANWHYTHAIYQMPFVQGLLRMSK